MTATFPVRSSPVREQGGDPERCWWCGDDPTGYDPQPLVCSDLCDRLLRVWWNGKAAGHVEAGEIRDAEKSRIRNRRPPWMEQ